MLGGFIPLVVEYHVFIMFCKLNPANLLLRRQNVEMGATISKTVLDLKNKKKKMTTSKCIGEFSQLEKVTSRDGF